LVLGKQTSVFDYNWTLSAKYDAGAISWVVKYDIFIDGSRCLSSGELTPAEEGECVEDSEFLIELE
jgi:hypothetical protein